MGPLDITPVPPDVALPSPASVDVTFPQSPFGGVVVQFPDGSTAIIDMVNDPNLTLTL